MPRLKRPGRPDRPHKQQSLAKRAGIFGIFGSFADTGSTPGADAPISDVFRLSVTLSLQSASYYCCWENSDAKPSFRPIPGHAGLRAFAGRSPCINQCITAPAALRAVDRRGWLGAISDRRDRVLRDRLGMMIRAWRATDQPDLARHWCAAWQVTMPEMARFCSGFPQCLNGPRHPTRSVPTWK